MTDQILLNVGVAAVPAAASIVAAVVAARSASRARKTEAEANRLRAAEERIAERKFKLYEPMLSALGNMMIPGNSSTALSAATKAMPEFLTFATVWASDDALQAFYRFRVASGSNPPTPITLRLVADFLVAARADLSGLKTRATGLEIIGMRVNDLYEHPEIVEGFTLPFHELAAKYKWKEPWA